MNQNTDTPPKVRADTSEEEGTSLLTDADTWLVLCDFDGTITPNDTADRLIEAFGNDRCHALETAWLAGEIGSRVCMDGQISELRASQAELDQLVDSIYIDPGFPGFVTAAQAMGFEVRVVSDGLDYVIARILRRYGLEQLPIYANRLTAFTDRRWKLTFPFAKATCSSGHCKCDQAQRARRQGRPSLLIGDGTSDFCVAARTDRVWAKGRLATYCQQQQIPFEPLRDFAQARAMLTRLRPGADQLERESHDQRNRIFA